MKDFHELKVWRKAHQLTKLIKPEAHEELAQRTIEVKRMLTALIQKLKADRCPLIADR
ncbi:MAG: hypothetical protein HY013_04925 [Candidatus Solibacter usitatus]|nr:hypothetical protein [Candidatus Solibacter usitatus]